MGGRIGTGMPTFEQLLNEAFRALVNSAAGFNSMNSARNLEVLGESFKYAIDWLARLNDIDQFIARVYCSRLREFRDNVSSCMKENYYQKL